MLPYTVTLYRRDRPTGPRKTRRKTDRQTLALPLSALSHVCTPWRPAAARIDRTGYAQEVVTESEKPKSDPPTSKRLPESREAAGYERTSLLKGCFNPWRLS